MNHIDIAWAAGFFEGEGSICSGLASKKHHIPTAQLQVTQVNREPLDKFISIFPFLKLYGPKKSNTRQNNQLCYVISTRKFEHVQQVCATLWPYLSHRRKDQIIKSLKAATSND